MLPKMRRCCHLHRQAPVPATHFNDTKPSLISTTFLNKHDGVSPVRKRLHKSLKYPKPALPFGVRTLPLVRNPVWARENFTLPLKQCPKGLSILLGLKLSESS